MPAPWTPAVGTVVDISTNTVHAVRGTDVVSGMLAAWSGMGFAPWWGAYGSAIILGGGHGDGFHNSIFRFDCETGLFSKIKTAAPGFNFSGYYADPFTGWMYGDVKGDTVQVGQPFAAHYYGGLVCIPDQMIPNGGGNGWLVHSGNTAIPAIGSAKTLRSFKIRIGVDNAYSHFGGVTANARTHGCSFYDAARNRLVTMPDTSYYASLIDCYTGVTRKLRYKTAGNVAVMFDGYYMAGNHDTEKDLYYLANPSAPAVIKMIDPKTGIVYTATTSGTAPTVVNGGFEWVQEWGALVYFDGMGNTVFTLKRPDDPLTQAWNWASQTLSGVVQTKNANPHWTRFRWLKSAGCFLWIANTDKKAQAFGVAQV